MSTEWPFKEGMVIHTTKDPRGGYCYYKWRYTSDDQTCIAFPDDFEYFKKLGFAIDKHWMPTSRAKGYGAVANMKFHRVSNQEELPSVDSLVQGFLDNSVSNSSVRFLLSEEA